MEGIKMNKKKIVIETELCLKRIAPEMEFDWLRKLKEPDLIELHELLLRVLEPEDLIQF